MSTKLHLIIHPKNHPTSLKPVGGVLHLMGLLMQHPCQELASVAMARGLRSLTRLAHGVFGAQRPLRHALPRFASVAPSPFSSSLRFMSDDHTAKWMQNTDMKSPMQLIDEVPPIKVDARAVACEGGNDPALGHPIEYISLDGASPAVCKYCGLRYYQGDAHGHH